MYSLESAEKLISAVKSVITSNKERLKKVNKLITQDTDYWIQHDVDFVMEYLDTYMQHHRDLICSKRKGRGNVLIILSYNEPFVLSVIPVLNAILAGNDVTVRTSSSNQSFFADIWFRSLAVEECAVALTHVNWDVSEIYTHIHAFDDVYYFGSHENAAKLSAECGKHYVGFHSEVEGADVKVILPDRKAKFAIKTDVQATLRDSFSHAGQSCQRVQGVFLPNAIKDEYMKELCHALQNTKVIDTYVEKNFLPSEKLQVALKIDIEAAEPKQVVSDQKSVPLLIFEPHPSSQLVQKAYFYPMLWVIGYDSTDELLHLLTNRTYHLGINIYGKNQDEIDSIIEKTYFSRYTVNSSHIDIRPGEGWGGFRPTGLGGNRRWIEHFSYPFEIID